MVMLRVGRRRAGEDELHRAQAVAAVVGALRSPAGAGELEGRLAEAHGVSARHARRWIAWALADDRVQRGRRAGRAATYFLAPVASAPPARGTPRVVAADVARLDPVARRDVALAVLALRDLGGRARGADLFAHVAARSGRSIAWARGAACDAADWTVALKAAGVGLGSAATATFVLADEAEALNEADLREWAKAPTIDLPEGDLTASVVRVLGDGPEMAPERTIILLPYLAVLGGSATWDELPDGGRGDLTGLARPRHEPAPTEWLRGRVAIAPGLASAWSRGNAFQTFA